MKRLLYVPVQRRQIEVCEPCRRIVTDRQALAAINYRVDQPKRVRILNNPSESCFQFVVRYRRIAMYYVKLAGVFRVLRIVKRCTFHALLRVLYASIRQASAVPVIHAAHKDRLQNTHKCMMYALIRPKLRHLYNARLLARAVMNGYDSVIARNIRLFGKNLAKPYGVFVRAFHYFANLCAVCLALRSVKDRVFAVFNICYASEQVSTSFHVSLFALQRFAFATKPRPFGKIFRQAPRI